MGILITIVSVPHTGTKFTESVLHKMGCETRHTHTGSEHPAQCPRTFLESERVVVPLRDPLMAAVSSMVRGETPAPEGFRLLAEHRNNPAVHFFRVDCPAHERVARLAALAEFCGAEVPEEDWAPVNTVKEPLEYSWDDAVRAIQPIENDPGVRDMLERAGYSLEGAA